jgi:hypothetical protein
MAVVLTWALFLLWAVVGLTLLKLGRHRWSLTTLLLSPAAGFAALIVPIYALVRFGVPVRVSGVPALAALVVVAAVVLWRARPGAARARGLWHLVRPFALVLVGTFGLTAWPMFGYGFDWVANGNDDMANYCVMATGYRDHAYAGVPEAADLRAGQDQTRAYWFGYFLREVRPGCEVLLALTSTLTGLPAVQVFMPVMVALNLALVAAASGLATSGTRRRAAGLATAGLLAVSSQVTYGVVQQLIAQAAGLALLCTSLALVLGRFRRLPRPVLLRRAAACGVVFAGQVVFYPEVIPILVGACVLLGVRELVRRRLDRRHLAHAGAAIAVMVALLPVYVYGSMSFMLLQGGAGGRAALWVKEIFHYYLTPRAGALVWGLLPFAGPEPVWFQTVAVLTGLTLLAAVMLPAVRGVARGRPFAAVLAVGIALGAALFIQKGAFGLFKLGMFVQPFLWAVVAAWVVSRRSRWSRAAALVALALVAGQNARVQFWYVDQSRGQDCRVALPAVSSRHGFDQFRAELARRAGAVDRVLVASDNIVLTKLVAAEVRGVPAVVVGANPFDELVRGILPMIEETPVARRHGEWAGPLRRLREEYYAGGDGPELRDPDTGAVFHRLIAEQPDRAGQADRVLVVAPGGALSVLNRFHQSEKGQPLVCAPLSELRNFAVFCDATGARQHFMGMREPEAVALQMMEADSAFRKRTAAGVGRAVVVDVLNPAPRVRVLVSATGSFRADPAARGVPPVRVVGDRRVPLGAVGTGAARLVSPPLSPQAIGPGQYLVLEFGEPARNPNRLPAAEQLWGTDLPRDRRWLSGHVRDISIITEEEYAAFRPPQAVAKFPNDLLHPHLEFSGFVEDGWAGAESKVRLTQPEPGMEAVIRGQIPGFPGNENFRTELTVFIDGRPVETRALKTGDFEVRAPAGDATGPRWVELRFSNSFRLPAPDGRVVAAHLRFVGFEPKNEALSRPPHSLAAFPADLAHPKLEHAGIYSDGWSEKTLRARLTQPTAGGEVVLRGRIPEVGGNAGFRTEAVLLLDGVEVARRELGPGDFELRGPAGKTAQARWVECRFTHTQALPPPDGRGAGAHIRFLGFEPQPAP